MKTFNVILSRTYKIQISAEDEKSASQLAEFFVGDPEDHSTKDERKKHKFNIEEIEMLLNDAVEVEEIEE